MDITVISNGPRDPRLAVRKSSAPSRQDKDKGVGPNCRMRRKHASLRTLLEDEDIVSVEKSRRLTKHIKRYVADNLRYHRNTPKCAEEAFRKVLYVHQFNCRVAKNENRYPYNKQLQNLLAEYVNLELEVAYRKENWSHWYEDMVKHRIWQVLMTIMYDAVRPNYNSGVLAKDHIVVVTGAVLRFLSKFLLNLSIQQQRKFKIINAIIDKLCCRIGGLGKLREVAEKHCDLVISDSCSGSDSEDQMDTSDSGISLQNITARNRSKIKKCNKGSQKVGLLNSSTAPKSFEVPTVVATINLEDTDLILVDDNSSPPGRMFLQTEVGTTHNKRKRKATVGIANRKIADINEAAVVISSDSEDERNTDHEVNNELSVCSGKSPRDLQNNPSSLQQDDDVSFQDEELCGEVSNKGSLFSRIPAIVEPRSTSGILSSISQESPLTLLADSAMIHSQGFNKKLDDNFFDNLLNQFCDSNPKAITIKENEEPKKGKRNLLIQNLTDGKENSTSSVLSKQTPATNNDPILRDSELEKCKIIPINEPFENVQNEERSEKGTSKCFHNFLEQPSKNISNNKVDIVPVRTVNDFPRLSLKPFMPKGGTSNRRTKKSPVKKPLSKNGVIDLFPENSSSSLISTIKMKSPSRTPSSLKIRNTAISKKSVIISDSQGILESVSLVNASDKLHVPEDVCPVEMARSPMKPPKKRFSGNFGLTSPIIEECDDCKNKVNLNKENASSKTGWISKKIEISNCEDIAQQLQTIIDEGTTGDSLLNSKPPRPDASRWDSLLRSGKSQATVSKKSRWDSLERREKKSNPEDLDSLPLSKRLGLTESKSKVDVLFGSRRITRSLSSKESEPCASDVYKQKKVTFKPAANKVSHKRKRSHDLNIFRAAVDDIDFDHENKSKSVTFQIDNFSKKTFDTSSLKKDKYFTANCPSTNSVTHKEISKEDLSLEIGLQAENFQEPNNKESNITNLADENLQVENEARAALVPHDFLDSYNAIFGTKVKEKEITIFEEQGTGKENEDSGMEIDASKNSQTFEMNHRIEEVSESSNLGLEIDENSHAVTGMAIQEIPEQVVSETAESTIQEDLHSQEMNLNVVCEEEVIYEIIEQDAIIESADVIVETSNLVETTEVEENETHEVVIESIVQVSMDCVLQKQIASSNDSYIEVVDETTDYGSSSLAAPCEPRSEGIESIAQESVDCVQIASSSDSFTEVANETTDCGSSSLAAPCEPITESVQLPKALKENEEIPQEYSISEQFVVPTTASDQAGALNLSKSSAKAIELQNDNCENHDIGSSETSIQSKCNKNVAEVDLNETLSETEIPANSEIEECITLQQQDHLADNQEELSHKSGSNDMSRDVSTPKDTSSILIPLALNNHGANEPFLEGYRSDSKLTPENIPEAFPENTVNESIKSSDLEFEKESEIIAESIALEETNLSQELTADDTKSSQGRTHDKTAGADTPSKALQEFQCTIPLKIIPEDILRPVVSEVGKNKTEEADLVRTVQTKEFEQCIVESDMSVAEVTVTSNKDGFAGEKNDSAMKECVYNFSGEINANLISHDQRAKASAVTEVPCVGEFISHSVEKCDNGSVVSDVREPVNDVGKMALDLSPVEVSSSNNTLPESEELLRDQFLVLPEFNATSKKNKRSDSKSNVEKNIAKEKAVAKSCKSGISEREEISKKSSKKSKTSELRTCNQNKDIKCVAKEEDKLKVESLKQVDEMKQAPAEDCSYSLNNNKSSCREIITNRNVKTDVLSSSSKQKSKPVLEKSTEAEAVSSNSLTKKSCSKERNKKSKNKINYESYVLIENNIDNKTTRSKVKPNSFNDSCAEEVEADYSKSHVKSLDTLDAQRNDPQRNSEEIVCNNEIDKNETEPEQAHKIEFNALETSEEDACNIQSTSNLLNEDFKAGLKIPVRRQTRSNSCISKTPVQIVEHSNKECSKLQKRSKSVSENTQGIPSETSSTDVAEKLDHAAIQPAEPSYDTKSTSDNNQQEFDVLDKQNSVELIMENTRTKFRPDVVECADDSKKSINKNRRDEEKLGSSEFVGSSTKDSETLLDFSKVTSKADPIPRIESDNVIRSGIVEVKQKSSEVVAEVKLGKHADVEKQVEDEILQEKSKPKRNVKSKKSSFVDIDSIETLREKLVKFADNLEIKPKITSEKLAEKLKPDEILREKKMKGCIKNKKSYEILNSDIKASGNDIKNVVKLCEEEAFKEKSRPKEKIKCRKLTTDNLNSVKVSNEKTGEHEKSVKSVEEFMEAEIMKEKSRAKDKLKGKKPFETKPDTVLDEKCLVEPDTKPSEGTARNISDTLMENEVVKDKSKRNRSVKDRKSAIETKESNEKSAEKRLVKPEKKSERSIEKFMEDEILKETSKPARNAKIIAIEKIDIIKGETKFDSQITEANGKSLKPKILKKIEGSKKSVKNSSEKPYLLENKESLKETQLNTRSNRKRTLKSEKKWDLQESSAKKRKIDTNSAEHETASENLNEQVCNSVENQTTDTDTNEKLKEKTESSLEIDTNYSTNSKNFRIDSLLRKEPNLEEDKVVEGNNTEEDKNSSEEDKKISESCKIDSIMREKIIEKLKKSLDEQDESSEVETTFSPMNESEVPEIGVETFLVSHSDTLCEKEDADNSVYLDNLAYGLSESGKTPTASSPEEKIEETVVTDFDLNNSEFSHTTVEEFSTLANGLDRIELKSFDDFLVTGSGTDMVLVNPNQIQLDSSNNIIPFANTENTTMIGVIPKSVNDMINRVQSYDNSIVDSIITSSSVFQAVTSSSVNLLSSVIYSSSNRDGIMNGPITTTAHIDCKSIDSVHIESSIANSYDTQITDVDAPGGPFIPQISEKEGNILVQNSGEKESNLLVQTSGENKPSLDITDEFTSSENSLCDLPLMGVEYLSEKESKVFDGTEDCNAMKNAVGVEKDAGDQIDTLTVDYVGENCSEINNSICTERLDPKIFDTPQDCQMSKSVSTQKNIDPAIQEATELAIKHLIILNKQTKNDNLPTSVPTFDDFGNNFMEHKLGVSINSSNAGASKYTTTPIMTNETEPELKSHENISNISGTFIQPKVIVQQVEHCEPDPKKSPFYSEECQPSVNDPVKLDTLKQSRKSPIKHPAQTAADMNVKKLKYGIAEKLELPMRRHSRTPVRTPPKKKVDEKPVENVVGTSNDKTRKPPVAQISNNTVENSSGDNDSSLSMSKRDIVTPQTNSFPFKPQIKVRTNIFKTLAERKSFDDNVSSLVEQFPAADNSETKFDKEKSTDAALSTCVENFNTSLPIESFSGSSSSPRDFSGGSSDTVKLNKRTCVIGRNSLAYAVDQLLDVPSTEKLSRSKKKIPDYREKTAKDSVIVANVDSGIKEVEKGNTDKDESLQLENKSQKVCDSQSSDEIFDALLKQGNVNPCISKANTSGDDKSSHSSPQVRRRSTSVEARDESHHRRLMELERPSKKARVERHHDQPSRSSERLEPRSHQGSSLRYYKDYCQTNDMGRDSSSLISPEKQRRDFRRCDRSRRGHHPRSSSEYDSVRYSGYHSRDKRSDRFRSTNQSNNDNRYDSSERRYQNSLFPERRLSGSDKSFDFDSRYNGSRLGFRSGSYSHRMEGSRSDSRRVSSEHSLSDQPGFGPGLNNESLTEKRHSDDFDWLNKFAEQTNEKPPNLFTAPKPRLKRKS